MGLIRCENCNYIMLSKKDYYECPVCHLTISKTSNINKKDIKQSKEELLKIIEDYNGGNAYFDSISKKLIELDSDSSLVNLLLTFIKKDSNSFYLKKAIISYLNDEKEEDSIRIILPFLINNLDYKYLTLLEEELYSKGLLEKYERLLSNAKSKKEENKIKSSTIMENYEEDDEDEQCCKYIEETEEENEIRSSTIIENYEEDDVKDELIESASNCYQQKNITEYEYFINQKNDKNIGIEKFTSGDYDGALEAFLKCKIDPEIHYYLCKIYSNKDVIYYDLDKAYEHLISSNDDKLYDLSNELGKKFFARNYSYDKNKAYNCFLKSSELGNDKAMCNLALCFLKGYGVEKNLQTAANYYKKSADLGNSIAMYEYSNLCSYKNSSLYNPESSIYYLIESANNNNVDAQYKLGVSYYKGQGVKINYTKSLEWLEKAINNGSKEALWFKNNYFSPQDDDYSDENCALELDDLDDLNI